MYTIGILDLPFFMKVYGMVHVLFCSICILDIIKNINYNPYQDYDIISDERTFSPTPTSLIPQTNLGQYHLLSNIQISTLPIMFAQDMSSFCNNSNLSI